MDVVAEQDLRSYNSLSEFFRRALKPTARPLCTNSCVTSPADGRVLSVGMVSPEGHLEQIKGVRYTLSAFLGGLREKNDKQVPVTNATDSYVAELMEDSEQNNALYHVVIYLAPGDYHRFHSPVDWQVRLLFCTVAIHELNIFLANF